MIGKLLTHGTLSEENLHMAKNLYHAKFENKLPLGGIATGHINLGCDGSITAKAPAFFVIKAEKDGELFDARILQSSFDGDISLPCFENSVPSSFFPFTEICFSDSSFPADVKMTSFSPFIPLNDTDSGIPAVCFELEVTSKVQDRIDYSVCLVSENLNENAYNRMGCTDTGEAYIHFSGYGENSANSCIATGGKNVSFCEYIKSDDDIISNFTKNETLCNKTKSECNAPFSGGALSIHFSLGCGEREKTVFCLSWYNPIGELSRNYYAQYFESALEAASYFLRQYDRLYSSSLEFAQYISGATLPETVIESVNSDLFSLTQKNLIRLDDGTLITGRISASDGKDAVTNLFPDLAYSEIEYFYSSGRYENASDDEKLTAVLRSRLKYTLTGDTDALIEDWYYIVKCLESVFGEDGKKECKQNKELLRDALEAALILAQAVRDKKREELYSSALQSFPLCQVSMDLGFANGYEKIHSISGFEYDAVKKHIGFNPDSEGCPLDTGGTFRCFFCTPTGYGYVEEGIDYVEINLLHGTLTLRSFGVPRMPRLVQYGGRNWKFANDNLNCILDSDLEVTPQKKLTILIDIK